MKRRHRSWLLGVLALCLLLFLWWYEHRPASIHTSPTFTDEGAAGPRELLIDLRDDADRGAIAALSRRLGLTLRANTPIEEPFDHLERATVPEDVDPAAV